MKEKKVREKGTVSTSFFHSLFLSLCFSPGKIVGATPRLVEEQTADYVTASSALAVPRLLEINFAGGFSAAWIIPRGLSVPTRICFYEKFLFRSRVPSTEHLFRNFFTPEKFTHSRARTYSPDYRPEISFSSF